MASLFGSGISGLLAAQRAMATAGHNIANAHTEGFSRQRVELQTRPAQRTSNGFIGAGVQVGTVGRVVDQFLIAEVRSATSAHGEVEEFHQLASRVDNLLADADGGLAPALQSFFGAIHTLAADPASVPARQLALSEGQGLVQRFHTLDERLDVIRRGVEQQLADVVGEVNALTSEIARLNHHIVRIEAAAGGQPANDLRDQRDELVRGLSVQVGITTVLQDGEVMNVYLRSGQSLVIGEVSVDLSMTQGQFDITRSELAAVSGGGVNIISDAAAGGKLGGLLNFRSQVLDLTQNLIGRVAVGLARTFNHQHRLGQDLQGIRGGDFFSAADAAAPRVLSHVANTGAPPALLDVTVSDVGALTTSDYLLERAGATYTLTRLGDGVVATLSGFPGAAAHVDGLSVQLTAGAIADGDQFLIQPTRMGARALELAVRTPAQIAAAVPIRTAASLGNAGDAEISAARVNSPDHVLSFTFTSPTTLDVLDETTGATLAAGLTYVPGGPLSFNGTSVAISGAPDAGDVFRLDHTLSAADSGNTGSATISDATLAFPPASLTDVVTITFDTPPTSYTVAGATIGSPTVNVPYTSGDPISFNGWTLTLSATPQAGDVFTVEPNAGGVGDNRNALALAGLQTTNTLADDSATYEEAFGQLIVEVGTRARQAAINLSAQQALLGQVQQTRDGLSGVNLDEEAANLLRYQLAFQANAQVIAAAQEALDTLIRILAR